MQRKYAVILGNLGNTRDRFCNGYKDNPPALEMLKQAAKIPHVAGIELVGTWDIRPDNVKEMRQAFEDLGMECVSIIPDLFGDKVYSKGSLSSSKAAIRRRAVDHVRSMCDTVWYVNICCNSLRYLARGENRKDNAQCAEKEIA